jgi:hypothetical protein
MSKGHSLPPLVPDAALLFLFAAPIRCGRSPFVFSPVLPASTIDTAPSFRYMIGIRKAPTFYS